MIFGCQSPSNKNQRDTLVRFDSVSPPVIVEANDFIINHLDTLPPPSVVMLSERPAPVKTTAGFYVTMQNFNTKDGLALSSILCSVKDQAGNLWFGTSGNGVSMYNGKSFTNYFSSHGLIHNLISTITEDSKGNLWFGTYGGVSKYDGVTFDNFTTAHGLANNNIYKILEDKKGNVWVGTSNGISRYNPSQQGHGQKIFVNYDTDDGLAGAAIIDILEDKEGNLWFGSTRGVRKYDSVAETRGEQAFYDVSENLGVTGQTVNTFIEDQYGVIWIGTDELLSRYDPDEKVFRHFTVADGLAGSRVLSSMEDSKGNLWFGTKQGASRYSKKDGSFLNFTVDQGLADNHVESITEDASGSLWFSTYGGGVSKYDGESVIEYSSAQGLPGKAVYAVVEDNKNNLWFAPLDGGIVEYRRDEVKQYGGTFVNYRNEQGFERATAYTSVQDRDGNLWFGTASGLVKFDGKSFSTFTTEQGLQDDYINALSTDRAGNLWIGTFDGGVSRFDGKSFTNFSTEQGLVHKTVWNIFEDKDGIIWIATRGGLSRYDGKQFMNFTTDQGLPDNKLSTLMQDVQGNLLTAGWGGGVSIIRKKHIERLAETDAGQNYKNIFEHFSTAKGLANDVVYNILEDSLGNLFIGTSYGLTILKGGISAKEGEIAREGIEIYNENTGYPIKDVSHIYSLFKDSRGIIWAGTGDKLVRFDYSSVNKRSTPPKVLIQNVKINNEIVSWHSLDWVRVNKQQVKPAGNKVLAHANEELQAFGRTLSDSERDTMASIFKNVRFDGIRPYNAIPENLMLPYNKNNVTFEFVGVETARPELIRYRYKLEGYDSKWSPETDKTTATFGNVFEGSYRFMIQAKSAAGVWSKPIMYSFKILPPWYRSWFAYLFYAFVFAGSVYSVHRFQKAKTIRNEREKIQQREWEQAQKIKKAYRELEVEAALEKVRSASVAMRSTSELQEVVNTVAQQMQKINININGGVFIVVNAEVNRDVPIWGSGGVADYVKKAVVPFLDRPIFKCLRDAIKEERDFLVENYSRNEKVEFFEHLFRHHPWNSVPKKRKMKLLSLPRGYTRSLTISTHTSIFIINNTGKKFSDEENDVLKRFGRVFEQSYVRFLDLQITEKQSREMLRQASLDRVRGEIASMRSTEDLQQIIPVIWRELTALGIPFFRCGILIFDESFSTIRIYLSASDGRLLAIYNLSYRANPFAVNVVEHWQKGMIYKEHWDREDFIKWMQSMTEQGQIQNKKEYPGANEIPESLYLHLIPFKQGMLYIGNHNPLTAEEVHLSKSLAEAFSIAYARYDDFNKLELAKEKVESALVELKAVQQQLVQQEKLASLGQLTAGIAHEIKNPLNFVTNFSDLSIEMIDELQQQLSETESNAEKKPAAGRKKSRGDGRKGPIRSAGELLEDIRENLRIINEHGRRADGIIKSMLQQSGSSSVIELTNLNTLIKEFVNFAYHGMRSNEDAIDVQISFDLDEAIGQILLQSQDFSRVITNLCKNAFDAMKEKRSSEKAEYSDYIPELNVTTLLKGDRVVISFKDNGSGIDPKVMNQIMQPFFTTKKGAEGTGLGLYITDDIVKAHRGSLEIESEKDTYTRIVITLPTQHARQA